MPIRARAHLFPHSGGRLKDLVEQGNGGMTKKAKGVEEVEIEEDAYYNKRCRCVMIDVVSHVDERSV